MDKDIKVNIPDIASNLNCICVLIDRIQNNCEEKEGVSEYSMYDDISEIQNIVDTIKESLGGVL